MLDPFSALAVAAACVQFLDFTWKVVTGTEGIFNKSNSVAKKDELASVSERLQSLSERLADFTEIVGEHEQLFGIRDKCRTIESELNRVLKELKDTQGENWDFTAHGKSRRWSSTRQALQHRFGKDLALFEKRLKDIRQNLILSILIELRAQQHQQGSPVASPSSSSQNLKKTERGSNEAPIGQQFLQSIDEKETWQKDLVAAILDETGGWMDLFEPSIFHQRSAKYFLETLAYPEMHLRDTHVSHSFDETFKWLFEPASEQNSWPDFQLWLADENAESTFWISGKPGSGKSTLIKCIDAHESTRLQLLDWAKEHNLVYASFYFWSAGSGLCKAREGLLRALLYQIFQSNAEMIALYSPRRAQVHQLFGSYPLPWTIGELTDTIRKVVQDTGTRFFFLIDGLDECAENHEELVSFLHELTKQKNAKMCLSSRPWPDFEDSYKDGPHLKLHELTKSDIRHFVECKLSSSRGFSELKMRDEDFAGFLVEEITQKSQGVFLWVQFVVRAILVDLKHGNRIEILRGRLEELPVDLEDLFQKLLDMIEDDCKEDAYQIFQLIGSVHTPMTLLMLSFAHEDGGSSYACEIPCEKLSRNVKEGRCSMMQRRLVSHCKGLLEVVPIVEDALGNMDQECMLDGNVEPAHSPSSSSDDEDRRVDMLAACTVQYMHRTVKDFLGKPDIWSSFDNFMAKPFDVYSALSRASLIRLKTTDITTMTTLEFWDVVCDTLHYAALSEANANDSLIAELDELDRAADKIARMPWPKEPNGNFIKRHMGIPHPHQRVPRRVQTRNESRLHWSAAQAKGSQHSFLCLAVQYGLRSYVEEKLMSGTSVEQPPRSRSLLDCAIRDHEKLSSLPRAPLVGFDQRLSMVKMLLEQNDDPNRVDMYSGTPWIHLGGEIKKSQEAIMGRKHERKHSRVFLLRHPQPSAPRQTPTNPGKMEFWLGSAELFVKYRANCWNIDIKGVTEALRGFDEQRAVALGNAMRTRRFRSFSHFWGPNVRRKNHIVVKLTIEKHMIAAEDEIPSEQSA